MNEKNEQQKQIDDAAVKNDKGVLRGHLAVGPAGQLVVIPPGIIGLSATVETGVQIVGLKPGWRLGTHADVKRKQDEEKSADAARAKAESASAKGNAPASTAK